MTNVGIRIIKKILTRGIDLEIVEGQPVESDCLATPDIEVGVPFLVSPSAYTCL